MKFNNSNWTKKEYDELIEYLKEIADTKYRDFSSKLIPGVDNMLGVQIPKLRDIAKNISKGNYNEFLSLSKNNYHEETMLRGLVIGYVKTDYESTVKLIEDFLPSINNWAVCDIFCGEFKSVLNNKKEFLIFLKKCINSNKEYYIRFAVIMLKIMYIDKEYIDNVLYILDNISKEEYYVKMAVAWTLCDCYIKFEEESMKYLKANKLDNFTYNKALQKIIESNRVSKENKEIIRSMKRK